ncbi:uncharacterized protein N7484_000277 [Penicillium longicatenatum]|uniref:uncharacterized protein n=1 Tax=Penicillium longicatenatum TaxID=1561947 RepID=UPI002547ED65|nr:uncharacterized protein N7484_000277 [Penicillium longicatenatum]KAJ5660905.1 hypothetical protein N7484_000277 [Penicillium longicatenatum]
MTFERRYSFRGDDTAYIKHLESRVLELERKLPQSLQRASRDKEQPDTINTCPFCEKCGNNTGAETNLSTEPQDRLASGDDQSLIPATGLATTLSDRLGNASDARSTAAASGNREGESSRSDQGTRDGNVDFILWNPHVESQKHRNEPSKYRMHETLRLKNFIASVSELPISKHWKKWYSGRSDTHWRDICGFTLDLPMIPAKLPTVSSSAATTPTSTDSLTPSLTPSPTPSPTPTSTHTSQSSHTPTPIEILLSGHISSLESLENTERNNACFRRLVLCSACVVALETTHVGFQEDVYKVMRRIFESNASKDRLQALGRGAKWINQAISSLSSTEWELRSWDIPLLVLIATSGSLAARFSQKNSVKEWNKVYLGVAT